MDNFLFTNGYELNDDIVELLIDLQWERLYISLDAATAATYKKIRGRDLQRVETNIEKLLEKKKLRHSALPLIRVSFVIQDENQAEKQLFFDKWKDKVDIIDYQTVLDYSDVNNLKQFPNVNYHCANPFRQLFFDYNGNMNPCCTEFGNLMPLGNYSNISIDEAWHSAQEHALRESLIAGNLNQVCRNCAHSMQLFE